ncbi:LTA synthase family protein [Ornithinimicrobium cryptoxanthini]|uniref:LTA synthase family protein n=1 Tax=Ornithinimicrobium cryptoxanthini TaxID=2934161 RepID=A0ABY4YNQ1_9MICO|nr:LTA synthase family protein [Ornithinimicrobium cryptoxanthini]USQ77988.1 LTA synthase family protein [Ornithinimicrobium cryptoxanthini]
MISWLQSPNSIRSRTADMNRPWRSRNRIEGYRQPHVRKWSLSVVELVVIGGLALKSTYLTTLILGAGGVMAGIPLAIWLVAIFWVGARIGRRAQKALLLTLMVGCNLVLYADLLHIRAFGSQLDLASVVGVANNSGLGPSILALVSLWDIIFFIDLLAVLIAYGAFGIDKEILVPAPRRRFSYAFTLFVVAYLAFSTFQATKIPVSPHQYLGGSGPLGVHANQLLSALPWSKHILSNDERTAVSSWLDRNSVYVDAAPEYERLDGMLEGKDVYLIVVESLEESVLNLEVDGQEVTPNINRILNDSIVFPRVVEQVRDGVTSDAELMLLTSMYPVQSGAAFLKHADSHYPVTLPRLLKANGYSSIAVNGDARQFWNRHVMFPNLGFDKYVAEEEFLTAPQIGMGVADETLFDQALIEREKFDSPSFMMISTVTSHYPWTIPESLKGLSLKRGDRTANYLQTLNYVDRAIGDFVEVIQANESLGEPAFVIVGDHEGIHKFEGESTWLEDNGGRVPFIVHVPGIEGEVIGTPGGQVDILPTLAYLLGVPSGEVEGRIMGRNLLGLSLGSAIDSEGSTTGGGSPDVLLNDAFSISDLAIRGDYFGAHGGAAHVG